MRSEQEVSEAIDRYADTVKRLCAIHLKNHADTEDVFQTVFIKYAFRSPEFESTEHEKAWIIRVTVNACKDLLKSSFRKRTVSFDEMVENSYEENTESADVIEAVKELPKKYRDVVYLYFYEGYTAVQIGKILSKNVNTVYTYIDRSKKMLRERLGGDGFGKKV